MGCYNVCSFSYNLKTHYALCMVIMQKECCWNLLHFIFLSSWKLQINYSTEFNQTAYINYGFGSQLTEKDYIRLTFDRHGNLQWLFLACHHKLTLFVFCAKFGWYQPSYKLLYTISLCLFLNCGSWYNV